MDKMTKYAVIAFWIAAGCSTIERAREAQNAVEGAAAENAVAVARAPADFHGHALSSLVEYAITNRPSFASAALAVASARLAMREIDADSPLVGSCPWNAPRLSVSGSYSERTEAQHAKGFSFKTQRGSPSAALSLDLLIYDFGRHSARAHAQAERVLAAELALSQAGYTVFEDVCGTYFTLLEKRALCEVAATNLHECAVHADYAQERLESGEAKPLDVLRAKLDLARARESCVAASNDVAMAAAEFLKAVGEDAAAGMRDGLGRLPEGSLSSVCRGLEESTATAEEIFAVARTNSPAMRIARAKLRAASAEVDYAVANLLPSVSASASMSWTDPLWTWGWGVSAVQSLFEGFRKTTAVDRAVVAMHQAEREVAEAEQRLSRDIELVTAARDNAREALRTAEDTFKTARENLDLVRRRHEVGEASRVDFTEAVADYVEAMGNRVGAFYRGQRAEAAIFALEGTYPAYADDKTVEELE